MTRVISVINLKGGVGKTTTTVGLAQILSVEFNKKILVVDLDAQTNATLC